MTVTTLVFTNNMCGVGVQDFEAFFSLLFWHESFADSTQLKKT